MKNETEIEYGKAGMEVETLKRSIVTAEEKRITAGLLYDEASIEVKALKQLTADVEKKRVIAKLRYDKACLACIARDIRKKEMAVDIVANMGKYSSFHKYTYFKKYGHKDIILFQDSEEFKEINDLTLEICDSTHYRDDLFLKHEQLMKEKNIEDVFYIDDNNVNIWVMFPSSMMENTK